MWFVTLVYYCFCSTYYFLLGVQSRAEASVFHSYRRAMTERGLGGFFPVGGVAAARPITLRVVDLFSSAVSAELSEVFAGVSVIALDAEGVSLSRLGRISIVQLSTPDCCVIVDVLDKAPGDPLVGWLRNLLENERVVKIIHDCCTDADALYHHLRIDLTNVHDTSCWHEALTGEAHKNLNHVLISNGLETNQFRDCSVYQANASYWARRPLTDGMKSWASGDVKFLFDLYRAQLSKPVSCAVISRIQSETAENLSWKMASVGLVTVKNPGTFIGRGGANIAQLRRSTRTTIHSAPETTPDYCDGMFMVYYHSDESFQRVRQAAARSQPPPQTYTSTYRKKPVT